MSGRTLTSSLVVRLIDQVSGPARKAASALLGLNKAGAGGTFGQRLGAAMERNNAALDKARGGMVDAVAGFYALKSAIAAPVREAMEFESAMADVRKVVDFPTPKAFQDFQQMLVDLSKRVPMSVNGLAQIAAAAGQAGIAGDDLVRFTEAAAKVGVAFDISADKAGDAMAKLKTGLGLTIDQVVLLTDSMNHLSNAQASSAADILDVVRRVGAQSKQFGFNAVQVSAFASAMLSAGAESDVAATSFRNMGLALTKGASATKGQRAAYKSLGLDAKKVSKNMQKDAVKTTIDVLERISKLPKHLQASVSSDLFGNEARALGPLLTNLGLLKETLGLISNETNYAGSSFKEYEVRAKTFKNAVQLFDNRLTALKIAIGAALIPAINDLMDQLAPVVDKLAEFVKAHPDLTKNVIMATSALIGFKIAMAGLKFVGLMGRGGALTALSLAYNTLGRAIIGASRGARGMVALQGALAAMSGAKYSGLAKVVDALKGMALAVPGVSAIGTALSAVGSALATVSAPVWSGIALAVAAVAAAGALMWKYWDRITSVVRGVASAIGTELAPIIERVQPILDKLAPIGNAIATGWQKAKEVVSEFATWIGSFFSREVLSEDQKAQWEAAGRDAATRMIQAIKAVFAEIVAWAKNIGSQIGNAIADGAIAAFGKIKGLIGSAGSLIGSGAPISAPGATDNKPLSLSKPGAHRATGGPVWPGSSFLVGERGEAEIFTPKTGGTITPVNKAGRAVKITNTFHITGDNPRAIASEVARRFDDGLGRALRGAHADAGADWS